MKVMLKRAAAALAATGGVVMAAAAALALGGSQAARAQDTTFSPVRKPYRVAVGLFIPSNGNTKDSLGNNWLSFGLGYDLKKTRETSPSIYEVYLDYFDRAKTTGSDALTLRSEAQMFAVGLADRYYLTSTNDKYQTYVGAGAGLYRVRVKEDFVGGGANRYKIGLGGKFLVGEQVNSGVFAEAEYDILPEPTLLGNRVKLSGFQARVGYRF